LNIKIKVFVGYHITRSIYGYRLNIYFSLILIENWN